jgi:DNA processing protein
VDSSATLSEAPATAAPSSAAEKVSWLRLIRTDHVGPATFWSLIADHGSASAALAALPRLAMKAGRASMTIPTQTQAEDEIARAEAVGAKLYASGEDGYPPLLTHIEARPPLIYQKGDPAIWRRPAIGIVGARNASVAGTRMAAMFAHDLGRAGVVVVSGLARGIDGAAHRAALPTGTAAVTAGGIDVIYPPEHAGLHAEICDTGVVVTECWPGLQPRAQDFPRRNRIISGCSLGVIVVEASERSGSLITARLSAEQGRDVFAVPGHPLDPRAEGPNALLKRGATLATCADDVLSALDIALREWPRYASSALPVAPHRSCGGGMRERDTFGLDDALSSAYWEDMLEDSSMPTTYGGFSEPASSVISTVEPAQPADETEPDAKTAEWTDARDVVARALQIAPVSVDDVIRFTGLDARTVAVALVELELAGIVERSGRQLVSLKGNAR